MASRRSKPPTTLAALTADPQNRRAHPEANLAMIATALKEVGAARSIVIDEDNLILAGNGVTQAAQQAGLRKLRVVEASGDEIIAVRRRGLTDAQKRALALYDNRTAELATWNVEQLLADQAAGLDLATWWTDDELAALLNTNGDPKAGLTDPDAVPEGRATAIQRGDLFELGTHRLLCGDSTDAADVARVMGSEKADLGFTSPPYGIEIDYGGEYKDTHAECLQLLRGVARTVWDVIKSGGFFATNFGDVISGQRLCADANEPCEVPMGYFYWPIFREVGWLLNTRRIWAKPHARVASPWCASSNRGASDWEHLWFWKKPGKGLNERRDPSYFGVWDTSKAAGVDVGKDVHAAPMAVALPVWALTVYSNTNDNVLEPFSGTGTTLIAAEQLTRRCRAIEIEPQYVQVSIDRWEAFTGQRAVKVGDAVRPQETRRKETRGPTPKAQAPQKTAPADPRRGRRHRAARAAGA